MNPSIPQSVIDSAMERDPQSLKLNILPSSDQMLKPLFHVRLLNSVQFRGRIELPPIPGIKYTAFADPSGGSADSFTLAISHEENGRKVLDCIRETKPPFNPDSVVNDYADLLRSYWLNTVSGDRYAGIWPESKFQEHKILK